MVIDHVVGHGADRRLGVASKHACDRRYGAPEEAWTRAFWYPSRQSALGLDRFGHEIAHDLAGAARFRPLSRARQAYGRIGTRARPQRGDPGGGGAKMSG